MSEYKKIKVNINGKEFEFTDGHDYWMKNDPEYKKKYESSIVMLLDRIEQESIKALS